MNAVILNKVTTQLDEQILRTLLYFDIFNYPLKSEEVFKFLGIPALDKSIVTSRLSSLTDQKIIFQFGELFSLKNDKALIDRRLKGNKEADKYLILARKKQISFQNSHSSGRYWLQVLCRKVTWMRDQTLIFLSLLRRTGCGSQEPC